MKNRVFAVVAFIALAAVSQALTLSTGDKELHITAASPKAARPQGMPAEMPGMPGMGGGAMPRATREPVTREQRGGDREQRMREEQEAAAQAAEQARTLLAAIASAVASGEDVTEEQQKEFGRAVLEIRKASRSMTPEDRSDMLLADAWYGYLTGADAESSSKKCLSAAKLSPTSDAAYYSLAAFSVLSSQQPPERDYFLKRVKEDAETVKGANLPFAIDYSPKQAVLTGKDVSFAGVSEKYFPVTGREALTCIYIWRSAKTALTADESAFISKNEVLNEYAKLKEPASSTDDVLRKSLAYVKKLEAVAAESDKLAVLSINVDTDLKAARDLSKKIELATVVFAETNEDFKKTSVSGVPQELSAFTKLFGNTILVSDKTGKILYAGTDFGILFRMFVANASGGLKLPKVEGINVPAFNAAQTPFAGPGMDPFLPGATQPGMPPQMPGMTPQMPGMTPQGPVPAKREPVQKPAKAAGDPNQPAAPADPNQPAQAASEAKAAAKTAPKAPVQLSTEDEMQAQKLVQEAEMLRGSYTRLGSSKKLIEVLQEIVKKYPGTPYEARAREIYDDIPDHQKKHYPLE